MVPGPVAKLRLAVDYILPQGGFCKARKGGRWESHAQALDLGCRADSA